MGEKSFFCLILQAEKMKLHIFNPEHDIALASNLSNFTAPHAGRKMRHDLGYLPALWADGGYVLVENVDDARKAYSRLMHRSYDRFVDKSMLAGLDIDSVSPWGWDLALRSFLIRYGVGAVPSVDEIAEIRELSHRKYAVMLLRELEMDGTTGLSFMTDQIDAVRQAVEDYGRIVVKAPWSSSGRGVRFFDGDINENQESWVRNVISLQQNVVVERYCNKVKDFGMEFESDGEGRVSYLGLSLFDTKNGAYTGNILASESEKIEMISRYISVDRLDAVKEKICSCLGPLYKGRYKGPLGVDLMIVRGDGCAGFLLNPCVEINLRRTMGHVALELSRQCLSGSVMRIDFSDGTYRLHVSTPCRNQ